MERAGEKLQTLSHVRGLKAFVCISPKEERQAAVGAGGKKHKKGFPEEDTIIRGKPAP